MWPNWVRLALVPNNAVIYRTGTLVGPVNSPLNNSKIFKILNLWFYFWYLNINQTIFNSLSVSSRCNIIQMLLNIFKIIICTLELSKDSKSQSWWHLSASSNHNLYLLMWPKLQQKTFGFLAWIVHLFLKTLKDA